MSGGNYVPFFYGHDWVGEFIPADLEELASELRSNADFLEGKARLLREQMTLAAQAIEARRAETLQDGTVHESAVPTGCAQPPSGDISND